MMEVVPRGERRLPPPLFFVLAAVVLTLPVGLAWFSPETSARFGDAEVFGNNRLGAGTISVDLVSDGRNGIGGLNRGRSVGEAVFSASTMAPGDQSTGSLRIDNSGTLPLQYWVTATVSPPRAELNQWLLYRSWFGTTCEAGEEGRTLMANTVFGAAPAAVASGPASADPAFVLAPGEEGLICVAAELQMGAPNSVQSSAVEVTLVVNARHRLEQDPAGLVPLPAPSGGN